MDASTSALFSEIYLQYIEHNKICKILQEHQIQPTLDYPGRWRVTQNLG
jgi:hypothetical protein